MGALVLSLKVGEDFYIRVGGNETQVFVDRIDGPKRFKLKVVAGFEEIYTITDRHSTMIFKQVRVSAGNGKRDLAKIAIEAPPRISILRGELVRKE